MTPTSSSCVTCGRAFPENHALAAIPGASKIAFDPAHRRVWRICLSCGEWNLLGPDASAAALPELEARFGAAVPTAEAGDSFAQVRIGGGVDLLRVGTADRLDGADSLSLRLRAEVDRREKLLRRGLLAAAPVVAIGLVVEVLILHNDVNAWVLLLSDCAQIAFLFSVAKKIGGGKVSAFRLSAYAAAAIVMLGLIGATMGIEHVMYNVVGLAFMVPLALIAKPIIDRYVSVLRVKLAGEPTLKLTRRQVAAVSLSWASDRGEISLCDLPGARTLSGQPAALVFRQLLPWSVQGSLRRVIAATIVTEKASDLLRAVGGLPGLLHALEGFRSDSDGRVLLTDLPILYLVALDLALSDEVRGAKSDDALRLRAAEAAVTAREAEKLDKRSE